MQWNEWNDSGMNLPNFSLAVVWVGWGGGVVLWISFLLSFCDCNIFLLQLCFVAFDLCNLVFVSFAC